MYGVMIHTTNPPQAYYCEDCDVFGWDIGSSFLPLCWSCGTREVLVKALPKWAGGSHNVRWDEFGNIE